MLVFGDLIRISRLTSVDQANINTRLIYNSPAAPDYVTPAVNTSTNKYTAPNSMQFGACLPWFLKKIWEADTSDGLVWISKWYISDAFHQCLLRPADISDFTYIVPPLPTDTSTLMCIDLVLPMGWVNSPYIFFLASETVADVANCYLLYPTSAFEIYLSTAGTYSLAPSPTSSTVNLQYVGVYMDNSNCSTQVDMDQQ